MFERPRFKTEWRQQEGQIKGMEKREKKNKERHNWKNFLKKTGF